MRLTRELRPLIILISVFLVLFWLPVQNDTFQRAVMNALSLARLYAREHVILCLVPAFLIAGAISVFVSQAAVIKYLGAGANKFLAYGVASVSGSILAVCSCTILPLFAGIFKRGAGIGPACAFLYSGPAINVLAIILTARVLGLDLGLARAVGAIGFSVVIGLTMAVVFRGSEKGRGAGDADVPEPEASRALWKNVVYFAAMVAILVFANWGSPSGQGGLWQAVYSVKWMLTSLFAVGLAAVLVLWFGVKWGHAALAAAPAVVLALAFPARPELSFAAGVIGLIAVAELAGGEAEQWMGSTWTFVKQIAPLLLWGILISGFLLGGTDGRGVIPSGWIESAVGGNSLRANLFASVVGALMYFVTLTEIPILQGLIASGMGKGPALALLLAGPTLSLPSMIVLGSVMGVKKTLVFIGLVILMATLSGMLFGFIVS